jgi:aminoglycoside phosphotransferase (APT) family kinase protein
MRDASVRNAIATLNNMLDTDVATAAWEAALQAPVWQGKAVWLHGDLHPGNLLVEQGRLTAVIDFGTLGVGDPACDLMVAWTLLSAENRDLFRAALTVDDATWARGRGWALSFGLIAFAYYLDTNPVLAAISRRAIDEVLVEHTNGI